MSIIHHLSAGAMLRASKRGHPIGTIRMVVAATTLGMTATACASAGPSAQPDGPTDDVATESEWQALASPRPAPLPGAVRLAFSGVQLAAEPEWPPASFVSHELGLSELVVAGLLRRRDVEFVERRRFTAAVESERSGGGRLPGSPPAGVSRGAELTATAIWLPLGGGQTVLEVRLANLATGAIAAARRQAVPADAEPVGAARVIVATILEALEDIDRLPDWIDPLEGTAAPAAYSPTRLPASTVSAFWAGLADEERWNWEAARRSYQSASATEGFFEAAVALARTARLRAGGTLGES